MPERQPHIHHYVQACLQAIDRRHPAFVDLAWNLSRGDLIVEVARRSRAAIDRIEVPGLQPEDPAPAANLHALPGETAGAVIERCRAGRWCSSGEIYDFPQGVDFTRSPDPSTNTRGCPFGEWTWQLNRHWEWRLATRLFVGTGDEAYVADVLGWIERWLEQAPPPGFDHNAASPAWRTIEIGIRLAGAWSEVLSVLAERFDDELWLAWLGAWSLQAPFAWHFRKHNNWLHMEMNGVVHAGVALPFMRDAVRWREDAINELARSFALQVHPDGMQYELSTGYHQVCVGNLERPVARLRAAGFTVPPAIDAGIADMYRAFRALARPDRRCWGFQDSGMTATRILANLPEPQRQPGDAWLIDGSGEPPGERHSLLPYAGYAVLRSGWDQDAVCLAFDGGPYGASHQHEDKLSFQLRAFGSELIGEAGTVPYADSPQRRYCLTTLAHSTAIVDRQGQSRGLDHDSSHIPLAEAAGLRHDLDAKQPWVEADYETGYGSERIPVRHTRRVTLVGMEAIEILDRFRAADAREHRVELLFHLLQHEVEEGDGGIATRGPGGNCALLSTSADSGETLPGVVTLGGEDPADLRGWAASPAEGMQLQAFPCWSVPASFSGELEIVTRIALAPAGVAATPRGA